MDRVSIIDNICGRLVAIAASMSLLEKSGIITQPAVRDLLNLYVEALSKSGYELQEIHNEMCENSYINHRITE